MVKPRHGAVAELEVQGPPCRILDRRIRATCDDCQLMRRYVVCCDQKKKWDTNLDEAAVIRAIGRPLKSHTKYSVNQTPYTLRTLYVPHFLVLTTLKAVQVSTEQLRSRHEPGRGLRFLGCADQLFRLKSACPNLRRAYLPQRVRWPE